MTTILFVPGNKIREFTRNLDQKKVSALLFDLEDSVKESHKDFARDSVKHYISNLKEIQTKIYLRANNSSSIFWAKDIEMIQDIEIDGIVLSKVDLSNLPIYEAFIQQYNSVHNKNIDVIAAIETLKGYSQRNQIMQSSIDTYVLGYEDISAELGIRRLSIYENNPLNRILNDLYISARMNGRKMFAAVTPDVKVESLFEVERESLFEKEMGLEGKFTIHPNQLEIVNSIFCYKHDLQNAYETIRKFDSVTDGSQVIVNNDGKMEDNPSVKRAKEIIMRYEANE